MKYCSTLQLFFLGITIATAGPPEPEVGFRWVINDEYSDEFNGNTLDKTKWNDFFTLGWKGRRPARFEPSSVSVSGGDLKIKNGVLENPSGGYTIAGGAVTSKKQTAHFGYYECSFKSSRIPMSTTFWMSNKLENVVGTTNRGVSCNGDRYRQELDIQESIGGAPDNRRSFRTDMHFNTHYRYVACGGGNDIFHSAGNNAVEGDGAKANSKLSSEVWEEYHTYGAYWKNPREVSFYADNKFAGDVNVKQTIVDNPFDRPMGINMVTETYDWLTNNGIVPTKAQLNNDNINTSYYNWVRSYKLVLEDEVVAVDYSGIYNQEIKYFEEPRLIGTDKVKLSYIYKANKELSLTVFVYEEGKEAVASATITLPRGYGKVQKNISLAKNLSDADYKFYVEMNDGNNLVDSIGEKPSNSVISNDSEVDKDKVSITNPVLNFDLSGSYTIAVAYEASERRDVVVAFFGENDTWQANGVVTVDAGKGIANVVVSNFETAPSAGTGSIYRAFIRPVGTDFTENLHTDVTENVTFAAAQQLEDSISIIEAVNSFDLSGTYTVTVNYEASESRELILTFLSSENQWLGGSNRVSVSAGTGTLTLTATLSSAPVVSEGNVYRAMIREVGGDFSKNKDFQQVSNVSFVDDTSFISAPKNGEIFDLGQRVSISLDTSNIEGEISKYQVYIDGKLKDTDKGSNYTTHRFNATTAKEYTIRVDITVDGAIITKEVKIIVNSSAANKGLFSGVSRFDALVFPNPIGESEVINVAITTPETSTVMLEIFSLNGALLGGKTYENLNSGDHQLDIDVSSLDYKGLVLLKISDSNGVGQIEKLVK